VSPMSSLTLEEHERFLQAWRAAGVPDDGQIDFAARVVSALVTRLATPSSDAPVIVLAGSGYKGTVGLAATALLHEAGVPVRLVLSGPVEGLIAPAAERYLRLTARGVEAWGLSLSADELDALEPVPWLAASLMVDTLLDADLSREPETEPADLIRMMNAARRPILAVDVPSGVSRDEGYILSPTVKASHTLAIGLPRRSVMEAAVVAGDLWVARVDIPDLIWRSLRLPPRPELSAPLEPMGPVRGLR
jgi:NAD(P)H-hydrate repair Nnr-like enzyme with NAD(P)H-hydrate epimerase domain